MNKLVLYIVIIFIHFFSYANKSCPEAWNSNRNDKQKQQNFPDLAKKILDHFYLKIEEIIPDIERSELEVLPETNAFVHNRFNRHKDNQYYKIAIWRGEKVFLKKIKVPQGEHELAVLRTFNHLGIPTLFHGIVRDIDGTLYMVSKFQEGGTLRTLLDVLQNVDEKYYESVNQQMNEIKLLFSKIGIFPADFQFMVSKEGEVYLIDVEMYIFSGKKAGEEKQKIESGIILNIMTKLKHVFKR